MLNLADKQIKIPSLMSVTMVEYARRRPGTRFNAEKNCYVGYRIDVRINKKRYRNKCFPTRREADAYIETLKLEQKYKKRGLRPAKQQEVGLRTLIDAKLASITDTRRKTFTDRVLNSFIAITGEFVKVHDVTYQDLKLFVAKRRKEVAEPTVNRELTEISSLLKNAGEFFPALEDYVSPKIPRIAGADNRRESPIYAEDEKAIIEYYNRPRQKNESESQYFDRILIGQSFEFALLTGSRRKEVVKLKKTDYQPRKDVLKITRWKTVKTKKEKPSVSTFSPIPRRVREILDFRLSANPGDYFFSKDGIGSQGYMKSLRLACEKLEIPYGRDTPNGLIFHDTRHTFVTRLLNDGVDLETVRDLAGLSRENILRYAHALPEGKRKAAAVLDKNYDGSADKLKSLYEDVKAGKISYEDFVTQLKIVWKR